VRLQPPNCDYLEDSRSCFRQERLEELVNLPSQPARDLLVKEKPFAVIAQAIRRKFNIEPPKVKECPSRPLQRKGPAELPTRVLPSGRSKPRSASPSSATRVAASGAREASPPAILRKASPSRTTVRGVSPSRATNDEMSDGPMKGNAPLSPDRQRTSTNAASHHTSRAPLHHREFDHHFLPTEPIDTAAAMQGERLAHSPIRSALRGPQKRLGILEPPIVSDSESEEFLYTRPSYQQMSSVADRYSKHSVHDDHEHGAYASAANASNLPPEGHLASQTQAILLETTGHSQHVETRRTGERSNPFTEYAHPAEALLVRHEEAGPSIQDDTSTDSFPDLAIPSSAPAPEPRAPANVTQRARRRVADAYASDVRSEQTPEEQLMANDASHITRASPIGHVPAVANLRIADHRHVDEPASASVDAAIRPNQVAMIADQSKAMLRVDTTDHDMFDDERNDKENTNDGNMSQQVTSVDPRIPDALANLQSLRAGIQALRQTHLAGLLSNQVKALPSIAEHGDSQAEVKILTPRPADERSTQTTHQATMTKEKHLPSTVMSAVRKQTYHQQVPSRPQLPKQNEMASTKANGLMPQSPLATRPPGTAREPSVETPHSEPKHPPKLVHKPTSFNVVAAAPTAQRVNLVHMHQGPPPSRQQVDEYQVTRAMPSLEDERASRNVQHSVFPPPKYPHPPRQQKLFSLKDGTPVNPGMQGFAAIPASATQSASESPHQLTQREPLTSGPISSRRRALLNPKSDKIQANVTGKMIYSFCLVLGALFGVSGLIQATTKVRDAYEYHSSLLYRINQFESSIVESYESVRKMDEKYAIWSEYIRELTEEDESNALEQLESIQGEVDKWQREMKHDLLQFKRSLSGDIIDVALAHLRESNATTA
jgi:hypothetical protein